LWLYPYATERQYATLIKESLKPLFAFIREYLNNSLDSILHGDSVRVDGLHLDSPGLKLLWETLNGWVGQVWPDDPAKAPPSLIMGIGSSADAVDSFAQSQWFKQTKAVLGFEFDTGQLWWKDVRDTWATRNYSLIKSISSNHIQRVNDFVEQAVTNGWSRKTVFDKIMKVEGMTKRRADRLARDQIGKLQGLITQATQQDAGIDVYIWRTSGDERVRGRPVGKWASALPSHWAMEGKLCKWSDSSLYSEDGGKTWKNRTSIMPIGIPGQAIQCRCTAIPYWDTILQDIDKQLGY
jgi:hypothetical protein